ncbi:hypothetical protein GCM10025858_29600 [Alicyclobacillus sacchari]|nr:hypothetical protein GCM10025858_29600 [Alicyclobacillus sacchari]
MIYGDYVDLSDGDEALYVYTRKWEDEVWLIILNHAQTRTSFHVPELFAGQTARLIIANYSDVARDGLSDTCLRPYEARVYALCDVQS